MREGWLTREEVFIIAKPPTEDCEDAYRSPDEATITWIRSALQASLTRLQTGYVLDGAPYR